MTSRIGDRLSGALPSSLGAVVTASRRAGTARWLEAWARRRGVAADAPGETGLVPPPPLGHPARLAAEPGGGAERGGANALEPRTLARFILFRLGTAAGPSTVLVIETGTRESATRASGGRSGARGRGPRGAPGAAADRRGAGGRRGRGRRAPGRAAAPRAGGPRGPAGRRARGAPRPPRGGRRRAGPGAAARRARAGPAGAPPRRRPPPRPRPHGDRRSARMRATRSPASRSGRAAIRALDGGDDAIVADPRGRRAAPLDRRRPGRHLAERVVFLAGQEGAGAGAGAGAGVGRPVFHKGADSRGLVQALRRRRRARGPPP